MMKIVFPRLGLSAAITLLPFAAHAYVGPGAGLTMLGSLWGLIVAVVFVVFGLLILPYKLMRNKRRRAREEAEAQAEQAQSAATEADTQETADP